MVKQLTLLLLFMSCVIVAQSKPNHKQWDASYFYGTILRHNKDIAHLITGHPEGFTLSYSKKTFGEERWQRVFNYPDYGISLIHHNSKDERLGNTYGLYGHYTFYFLRRHMTVRIGQGVAYATHPFDLEDNFKNNAYGSRLLSSSYMMLNYDQPLTKTMGMQFGIQLIHFSNANFKAPNASTNTFAFNIGLQYKPDATTTPDYIKDTKEEALTGPIKFDIVLRGGLNESDFVGLGQHPFFVVSAMARKRLSFLSSVMVGSEYFHARFLEKEIAFLEVAFPNRVAPNTDFQRVGIFAGYQLHINRLSFLAQLGYYLYYPYDFEGRFYQRLGLQYDISRKLYVSTTLKTHGAKAEALELGIGFKL